MTTYTAEDLIAEARERHPELKVSERMIVDWVQKGLLGAPRRTGRGEGGGRGQGVGAWTELQRKLFFTLLDQHAREAKRLPTLCNVPVFLWLHFGDPYASTEQIAKAMKTYTKAYRRGSLRAARVTAREMVDKVAHPASVSTDHDALFDLIVQSANLGRVVDREALVEALRRVYDPLGTGRGQFVDRDLPEQYATMLEARVLAIGEIDRIEEDVYRLARDAIRSSLDAYANDVDHLRADADLGHLFEDLSWEGLAKDACRNLLTAVGVMLLAGRKLTAGSAKEPTS